MTDTMTTPPAGWYPDPADARAFRWWSGEAWTEQLIAATTTQSPPYAVDASAFHLIERDPEPVFSYGEQPESSWDSLPVGSARNRSSMIVVIIGVVAIAGYAGSVALGYSTIIPLIPGVIGLLGAVPAFRRARVTGNGIAVSLLGVLLSGVASVLSVMPLVPMLLGIPSASEVNQITSVITAAVAFPIKVQNELVARAPQDFGQKASSALCPSDAVPIASSTFSCTETLADGTTAVVNVTVTDSAGAVTWAPAA